MMQIILPEDLLKGLRLEHISPMVGVLTARNVRPIADLVVHCRY